VMFCSTKYLHRLCEVNILISLGANIQEPLRMSDIEVKQKDEIEFWRNLKDESPEAASIYNIVNKVSDAGVFLDCLKRQSKVYK